jgi:hypothetical protein
MNYTPFNETAFSIEMLRPPEIINCYPNACVPPTVTGGIPVTTPTIVIRLFNIRNSIEETAQRNIFDITPSKLLLAFANDNSRRLIRPDPLEYLDFSHISNADRTRFTAFLNEFFQDKEASLQWIKNVVLGSVLYTWKLNP